MRKAALFSHTVLSARTHTYAANATSVSFFFAPNWVVCAHYSLCAQEPFVYLCATLTLSRRHCGFIRGSVSVWELLSSESRPRLFYKNGKKSRPKFQKLSLSELHFQQIWYNFAQMNGQELPLPRYKG
jgi:hypothetical protein